MHKTFYSMRKRQCESRRSGFYNGLDEISATEDVEFLRSSLQITTVIEPTCIVGKSSGSRRILVSSQTVISDDVTPPLLLARTNAQVLKSVRSKRARIAVLGMGHVGLPTALGLAAMGWTVLGADSSQSLISQLQAGETPFYEPGLEELLKEHLGKRFFPLDDLEGAIRKA